MPRALFTKTGNAVWMSHLDLMRLFQRAFKRAGLPLTHTQGFNPRPSVSIALPLSVGVQSNCELLDFDLEGEKIPNDRILQLLNENLVEGVRVLEVYDEGRKLKHLAYLDCIVTLEYDAGVETDTVDAIRELFSREEINVEKKGKNGPTVQNIAPMIRKLEIAAGETEVILSARVCCQNPTLNPSQLAAAVQTYLPQWKPSFTSCARAEIYDTNETVFR